MSVFSKIFIVINLFLTLALVGVMGTLLSQKADYKAQYSDSHGTYRTARGDLGQLKKRFKKELESVESEDGIVSQKIKTLEGNLKTALANRGKNSQEINAKQAQGAKLETNISKTNKAYADLDKEVKDLIGELEAASKSKAAATGLRSSATSSLQDRLDRKQDLVTSLADLQRNYKMLGERNKRARFYIKEAQLKAIPVAEMATERLVPKLKGIVETNQPGVELCMVSLGKNDGVFKGLVFRVARGSKYVGLVKVKDVYPNMCSCRYMTTTFYPGRTIAKNDQVVTERK